VRVTEVGASAAWEVRSLGEFIGQANPNPGSLNLTTGL